MDLYVKQNNKDVSLCFMNNDTFKKMCENRTEEELVELANGIYESALKVLSDSEKRYARIKRQMDTMDEKSVLYEVALRKLEKTNKTIESINEALDNLEEDKKEFCWIKYMIEACFGHVDEDEED